MFLIFLIIFVLWFVVFDLWNLCERGVLYYHLLLQSSDEIPYENIWIYISLSPSLFQSTLSLLFKISSIYFQYLYYYYRSLRSLYLNDLRSFSLRFSSPKFSSYCFWVRSTTESTSKKFCALGIWENHLFFFFLFDFCYSLCNRPCPLLLFTLASASLVHFSLSLSVFMCFCFSLCYKSWSNIGCNIVLYLKSHLSDYNFIGFFLFCGYIGLFIVINPLKYWCLVWTFHRWY